MGRSVFPWRVALAALMTLECGGGSGSPMTPSSQPAQDISLVSGAPAPGSPITVADCSGTCTRDLLLTFSVTFATAIPDALLYVELFNPAGTLCAFNFTDPRSLSARQPTQFISDFLVLGPGPDPYCTYPATTTRIHTSLLSSSQGINGPRLLEKDFAATYTFDGRAALPAPAPTPEPPTHTPKPGGGGSATCNGDPVPAACQVGNGPLPPTARCKDGLWSCSQNASGTCSHNGGVDCWVCPGVLCH